MGELDDKIAVITGAGSGMGRACSRTFLREGAKVLGADITGRQNETAEELGDGFVPFQGDISAEADVEAMFAATLDAFGRVDAVLNVAGLGSGGMLADVAMDEWDRIMNVNLKGVMLGTKHGVKAMLPTGGGVILNWSSIGGMNASIGTSVYGATKAGVISLTKSACIEYGPKGIRANAICPGFVETEMSGGPGAGARFPHMIEASALKRAAQPEEIAELASFLASDRAGYISGAIIPIDGGATASLR